MSQAANEQCWGEFRRQMPVAQRLAYFDHAAVGPLPRATCEAICRFAHEAAEQGDTRWPQWNAGVERVRTSAAQLIGAAPGEMALVKNTTDGISIVAEGFPWQSGDNVVTLADEFPSNQYPWLNLASRGVETRRVPTDQGRLDLNRLDEACNHRTRIVSISWVGYATGYRHDLAAVAEIAHRHGALLFVDAIQALGVFPIDVAQLPVDFLAADGHKWLLGPEGAGLLYIRREHLDRLRPLGVGWHSVVQGDDFARIEPHWKPAAERYEGGSQNMVGFLGLGASLELLARLGTAAISQRILQLTDQACQRLQQAGAHIVSHRAGEHRSGIIAFEIPGADLVQVRERCLAVGVVLSHRAGRLRIAPHAYNNASDIDRLIDGIVER